MVFLDEPTGGVDPISRRRFWDLIDGMAAEGVTVLVTTHYLDEAEHCDRIALMHDGKLAAEGSVAELKHVFAGRAILEVTTADYGRALEALERDPELLETSVFGTRLHVVVGDGAAGELRIREVLAAAGIGDVAVARIVASLEDVFIHTVESRSA
jgi:ABC-2 type transport system ATP-binding protein